MTHKAEKAQCPCPPDECHNAGAVGCYFGTAPNAHTPRCTPETPCAGGLCDGTVERFVRGETVDPDVVNPPASEGGEG